MATEKTENSNGGNSQIAILALVWLMSVLCAISVGWAWVKTHPQQMYAKVDIQSIMDEHVKNMGNMIRPDMPKSDQEKILAATEAFGKRLDRAMAELSIECGCAVLNAAAIIRDEQGGIPDLTLRVRQIMLAKG